MTALPPRQGSAPPAADPAASAAAAAAAGPVRPSSCTVRPTDAGSPDCSRCRPDMPRPRQRRMYTIYIHANWHGGDVMRCQIVADINSLQQYLQNGYHDHPQKSEEFDSWRVAREYFFSRNSLKMTESCWRWWRSDSDQPPIDDWGLGPAPNFIQLSTRALLGCRNTPRPCLFPSIAQKRKGIELRNFEIPFPHQFGTCWPKENFTPMIVRPWVTSCSAILGQK